LNLAQKNIPCHLNIDLQYAPHILEYFTNYKKIDANVPDHYKLLKEAQYLNLPSEVYPQIWEKILTKFVDEFKRHKDLLKTTFDIRTLSDLLDNTKTLIKDTRSLDGTREIKVIERPQSSLETIISPILSLFAFIWSPFTSYSYSKYLALLKLSYLTHPLNQNVNYLKYFSELPFGTKSRSGNMFYQLFINFTSITRGIKKCFKFKSLATFKCINVFK